MTMNAMNGQSSLFDFAGSAGAAAALVEAVAVEPAEPAEAEAHEAPTTAVERRDQAIRRVKEGATVNERQLVEDALDAVIERHAVTGAVFTSEDVIAELGDAYQLIREPRLIGALMMAAARRNRIVGGDYVRGSRPERHSAPVRTWTVTR
jgi:hypothetical protein